MARKKEAREKEAEKEPAEEGFAPEQIGTDDEGQPEFSLQPQQKEKKDPTAVEFKHSYVVENIDTKDLGKKKTQERAGEISETEREEDYWYVG